MTLVEGVRLCIYKMTLVDNISVEVFIGDNPVPVVVFVDSFVGSLVGPDR